MKWETIIFGLCVLVTVALYADSVAAAELQIAVKILIWGIVVLILTLVLGFTIFAAGHIRLRLRLYNARVITAIRDAEVMTVTAPADEQVYIRDQNHGATWSNPSLDPRATFGLSAPAATVEDRQQWFLHMKVKAIAAMAGQKVNQAVDQGQNLLQSSDTLSPIPERVDLEPMLARRKPSLGKLILGVAEGENIIYGDARQLFHILVAGSTRWGKSIFLQMFLYQLLHLDNVRHQNNRAHL